MKTPNSRSVQHKSKLKQGPSEQARNKTLAIHDMSHDGRGVGKIEGKTVFVTGALLDEVVEAQIVHQKSQYFEAKVTKVISPSADRIEPACQHFGVCGGCQLQHISATGQMQFKQNQLARSLVKAGIDTGNTEWLTPLTAEAWHYRRRARWAINRQGQLCFRAIGGKQLVAIEDCPQLSSAVNALFHKVKVGLAQLPYMGISEIECLAIGETAIVLSTNQHWRDSHAAIWSKWCTSNGINGLAIQSSARVADLTVLMPCRLTYQLDGIQFNFTADQFIQTHETINQRMVALAKDWLAASKTDKVLELFCGMGNFSLPIAQTAQSLLGLELNHQSITTAKENATLNHVDNVVFAQADLFAEDWLCPAGFSHVLLDPPRDGAAVVCGRLAKNKTVKRIVYVSCHPATLARDIVGLQKAKFKLEKMVLIDQFPQSYHVEAMALLVRD
ncbi:MAG: methyltransferase domain-containing protein [Thiotrichales bacterium]|jgi:23S rRNA (uracil1939-C5)-methyltransferase|nr:methyltransferase domain-containing protein [Thiotrichales bacterium]